MDIPILKKNTETEEALSSDISVKVASAVKSPEQEIAAVPGVDAPKNTVDKNEESRKKIIELISSKKYQLDIKEKRAKPLLTLSILPKRSKKSKKKQTVSKKTEKKPPKKVESKKAKLIKLGIILVMWAGFYVALDMGVIEIGWRPPFTIFGEKQASEVSSFSGGVAK